MTRIALLALLTAALGGCATFPDAAAPELPRAPAQPERVADLPLPEAEPNFRLITGNEIDDPAQLQTLAPAAKPDPGDLLDRVRLDVVQLDRMPLAQAAVMLTRMIGQNVVVSSEARNRSISIYLSDVSARAAIEGICRLHDLWYREDPEMIRILTEEEYGRELVVRRDEQTRLYYLKNASAPAVADMIATLMPGQVEYYRPGEESSYGHVGTDGDEALSAVATSTRTTAGRSLVSDDRDPGGVSRSSYLYSPADVATTFERGLAVGRIAQEAREEPIGRTGEVRAGLLAERGVVTAPVTLSVFLRNNCIGVRTVQESMHREIGRIIDALDTATRQVLLEVKVLRVALGEGDESLFSMSYGSTSRIPEVTTGSGITYRKPFPPGIPGSPDALEDEDYIPNYRSRTSGSLLGGASLAGSTVSFTYLDSRISATLQLLRSDNRLHVVATPMLLCANNAPAEFFSGITRMITTNYDYETRYGDDNEAVDIVRPIVEEREIGTQVRIKPSINSDGTVTLRFLLQVASVNENGGNTYQVSGGEVVSLPIDTIDNEKIESIVVGKHGQAVVMGGLISESKVKSSERVPGLGKVPVLRRLFGQFRDTESRAETVIIIIPHIIASPAAGEAVSETVLQNNSLHPWLRSSPKPDEAVPATPVRPEETLRR